MAKIDENMEKRKNLIKNSSYGRPQPWGYLYNIFIEEDATFKYIDNVSVSEPIENNTIFKISVDGEEKEYYIYGESKVRRMKPRIEISLFLRRVEYKKLNPYIKIPERS